MGNNNDTFLQQLGQDAAQSATGGIVGAGMGLLLAKHNDRRQIRQQQKLTDMQVAANKNLAEFSYQQQLKMWHDTNYNAQMKELEKAGLNPGLMYGMGGGGGQSIGSGGAGTASGGQAPSGGGEIMGLMMQKMQLGLMEEQRKNIQADTENKQAQTTKTAGVDTQETQTKIASLTQGIQNAKAQEAILNIDKIIKEATAYYASGNEGYNNEILQYSRDKIESEMKILDNEAYISNHTRNQKISLIRTEAVNAIIKGHAMRMNITLDQAKIENMATEIQQGWEGLTIKDKEQKIQQLFLEKQIQMADIDRIINSVDVLTNTVKAGKGFLPRKH